jgi:enoyl-CoA hydratase
MSEPAAEPMLIVAEVAPGVRELRLNRPERRNALATPLLAEVAAALRQADADEAVRCILVTGGDKIFAAGADIREMAEKTAPGALADRRTALWAEIRAVAKPMVAAVSGWCLGAGCELLMCCDLSVAARDAKFGQPETNLGIIPGAGGTATLPRLVGRTAAMKLVLLGEPVSAEEAQALGLVGEVVEPGQVADRALEIASKIAGRAPVAMRQAKAMVRAAFDLPHTAHLAAERQAFALLFATEDKAEGVQAFLDKRPPEWRGR